MNAPKTLTKLKKDPRVKDAWDEGEDGYWVLLQTGFADSEASTHALHERNIKSLLGKMKYVKKCECEDCLLNKNI